VFKGPKMTEYDRINRRYFILSLAGSGALLLTPPPALALKLSRKKQSKGSGLYIPITAKERCPVCGMFVRPYPKWITQIQFKNGSHHSFDGMKCFCRFYFEPGRYHKEISQNDFKLLLVRDYYTLKFIKHDQAYYVIGSNVIGPMGHELIPFADEKNAGVFLVDHKGLKILRFDEVTVELLDLLDRSRRNVILNG